MTIKKSIEIFLVFFITIICNACSFKKINKSKTGIVKAMKKYDDLILKLDVDAISLLFTEDGNLGNVAMGRDSIKKFLSSFKNIDVLVQSSNTSSIIINGDSAIETGKYFQTDLINKKDTIKINGAYTTNWVWVSKKGWLIKKIVTTPQ